MNTGDPVKISIFMEHDLHKRLKITAYENDTTIQGFTEKAIRVALATPDTRPQTATQPMTKKDIRRWARKLVAVLEQGDPLAVQCCTSIIQVAERLSKAVVSGATPQGE